MKKNKLFTLKSIMCLLLAMVIMLPMPVKAVPAPVRGADVSSWQGKIDWKKFSNSGLGFVIIRCGHGLPDGSSDHGSDTRFESNYAGAKAVGLPVGVYFYSTTLDSSGGVTEANYVLSLIKGKSFDLPVFIDREGAPMTASSKETNTKICVDFCETIQRNGYKAGVYSSSNHYKNHFDLSQLTRYSIWVANYGKENTGAEVPAISDPDLNANYQFWQFTSNANGYAHGTSGGGLDLDYWYSNWLKDRNGWWYRYDDGTWPANKWTDIDGVTYHFNAAGYMDENKWVGNSYVDSTGAMVRNAWIGDHHVNADGIWDYSNAKGNWISTGGDWKFRYSNGTYAAGKWEIINYKWYYFDGSGRMLKNQYHNFGSWGICYINMSGLVDESRTNGHFVNDNNGTYYTDNSGFRPYNTWLQIDETWYYFNSKGYMEKNAYRDGCWLNANGAWDRGAGAVSWKQNSKGWWFQSQSGWYPVNQWLMVNGLWYHFDASGYMDSNEYIGGCWLNASGEWDERYGSGRWVSENGGTAYVDGSYRPRNRWLQIDNNYYYFDANGNRDENGYRDGYWLNADGSWARNTTMGSWRSNSRGWWYQSNAGWYPRNEWLKVNGLWYYFYADGYMAANTTIGGYKLAADGHMI